jgi:hypothetical protein
MDYGDHLTTLLNYSTELFRLATMQRFLDRHIDVLRQAVANPDTRLSKLGLVGDEELSKLSIWGNLKQPNSEYAWVNAALDRRAAIILLDPEHPANRNVALLRIAKPDCLVTVESYSSLAAEQQLRMFPVSELLWLNVEHPDNPPRPAAKPELTAAFKCFPAPRADSELVVNHAVLANTLRAIKDALAPTNNALVVAGSAPSSEYFMMEMLLGPVLGVATVLTSLGQTQRRALRELIGVQDGQTVVSNADIWKCLRVSGVRIDPFEISNLLERHPGVRRATTNVFDSKTGERRIVVHFEPTDDANYTETEFREMLRQNIPDVLVPRDFVEVQKLPTRFDGSIDKSELPGPFVAEHRTQYIAPRTETEVALSDMWKAALKIQRVSAHDKFFDLGGHSLLCFTVLAQMELRFRQRISPRVILLSSLEQIAASIDEKSGNFSRQSERVPLRHEKEAPISSMALRRLGAIFNRSK